MCGRYSTTTPADSLARLFLTEITTDIRPRYNVAPTQNAPVIRQCDDGRRLDLLRWGLVPSWSKNASAAARMINARAETVAEKPSFRAALKSRRCLVTADGFFEWRQQGKIKQPYRICLNDARPFAFAGLWESWRDPAADNAVVETYTIVTTRAVDAIAHIHHRMPVILEGKACDFWLNGSTAGNVLNMPFALDLKAYAVSPRIGNIRNDDPDLLAPFVDPEPMLF